MSEQIRFVGQKTELLRVSVHFSRQVVFIGLVFTILFLTGCEASGNSAPSNPAQATIHPSATPLPAATLTLPVPTQIPTPSPVPAPTGISPTGGKDSQPGQNAYSAVVSYQDKTSGSTISQTIHFLLYLPVSYGKDPAKRWPLILYLHGSGERGKNLPLLRSTGLPKILDGEADFPFIVVSPQCPGNVMMWSSQIDALNALLDQIQARYSVDPQRQLVTGFSMGGFGAWEFALRYPQRFAAIVPVAGGYIYQSKETPQSLCDLKHLPVWVFHGGLDTSVALEQATSLIDALKACLGNVRFTFYADADHNQTAQRAYVDPELYTWLAAQKRP